MATAVSPCPFPYMPVPYGCYCGLTFGKPDYDPVDDFDELCKHHDECYEEVEQGGCKSAYDEYIAPYSWELNGSTVRNDFDFRFRPLSSITLSFEFCTLLVPYRSYAPRHNPLVISSFASAINF